MTKEKKITKEEIYKELKHTLKEFEDMNYDVEELYEMLWKIEKYWKVITQ